jgi:hypothetical protein
MPLEKLGVWFYFLFGNLLIGRLCSLFSGQERKVYIVELVILALNQYEMK